MYKEQKMNPRYIHFDSSYRDRNCWPNQAEFEVPISQTGPATSGMTSKDPITKAAPISQWSGQYFGCVPNIELPLDNYPPKYKIPAENYDDPDADCYNTTCLATHIMQPQLIGQVLANWPNPTATGDNTIWTSAEYCQSLQTQMNYSSIGYSSDSKNFVIGIPGIYQNAQLFYTVMGIASSTYYRDLMIAVYEVAEGTETLAADAVNRKLLGVSRIQSISYLTTTVAALDLNFFGLGSTDSEEEPFELNIEYGLGMNLNTPLNALSVVTDSSPFGCLFSNGRNKVFRIVDPSSIADLPYTLTVASPLTGIPTQFPVSNFGAVSLFIPGTRTGDNAFSNLTIQNQTLSQSCNPSIPFEETNITSAYGILGDYDTNRAMVSVSPGSKSSEAISGNQFRFWRPYHSFCIREMKPYSNRPFDCSPYNYNFNRLSGADKDWCTDSKQIVFTNLCTWTTVQLTSQQTMVADDSSHPDLKRVYPDIARISLPNVGATNPFQGCFPLTPQSGAVAHLEYFGPANSSYSANEYTLPSCDPFSMIPSTPPGSTPEYSLPYFPSVATRVNWLNVGHQVVMRNVEALACAPSNGEDLKISFVLEFGRISETQNGWFIVSWGVDTGYPGIGFNYGDDVLVTFQLPDPDGDMVSFRLTVLGIAYPEQHYDDYNGWYLRFLPQLSNPYPFGEDDGNEWGGQYWGPEITSGDARGMFWYNGYDKYLGNQYVPFGTYQYYYDETGRDCYVYRKISKFIFQPLNTNKDGAGWFRCKFELDEMTTFSGMPTPTGVNAIYPYFNSSLESSVDPNYPPNRWNAGRISQGIEILPFWKDTFNPFTYTGSMVSQQEMVCYKISLLNVILPNVILKTGNGNRIAFYPYVWVTLSNVSAAGAGNKNLIYSNSPHATRATFMAAVDDVANPTITQFVKIDGDGMQQTMKFKPNDNMYFSVTLPNGQLFETLVPDAPAPWAPNSNLQTSVCFAIERL